VLCGIVHPAQHKHSSAPAYLFHNSIPLLSPYVARLTFTAGFETARGCGNVAEPTQQGLTGLSGGDMPGNSYNDFFSAVLNNSAMMGPLLLIARVFMAAVFVIFGIYKIVHNTKMKGYMTAHGVPSVLIYLVILVQISGGILVVLGYQTRFAAVMLAGFCIVAPLLFHTDFKNGTELAHFTKDFAIAGGFLFMIAYGPGPLSLDEYLSHARSSGEYQNRPVVTSPVVTSNVTVNRRSPAASDR